MSHSLTEVCFYVPQVLNGKASSVENNEAVITIFVEIPSFVLSGKQMGICSLDFSVNATLRYL